MSKGRQGQTQSAACGFVRRVGPWILTALLFLGASPLRAALPLGDLLLNVEAEPPGTGTHGYAEYWVTLSNKSESKTHLVTLSLPRSNFSPRERHLRSVSRSVEVRPRETVRVSLLVPPLPPVVGNGLQVAINGRDVREDIPLTFNATSVRAALPYGHYSTFPASPGGPNSPLVLVSRAVPGAFSDEAGKLAGKVLMPHRSPPPPGALGPGGPPVLRTGKDRPAPGTSPAPPANPAEGDPDEPPATGLVPPGGLHGVPGVPFIMGGYQLQKPEGPISTWSDNWLGYSRYDGIVLTDADQAEMSPAVQTALWQYAETGGSLLLLGRAKVPEHWRRFRSDRDGLEVYAAGFGQCLVCADTHFAQWPAGRWAVLANSWGETQRPWQNQKSLTEANGVFAVVADVGIPLGGLFVLMVVFAVLIGPANLMILSRLRRRIWLLGTVPLLSFLTCAAVFGYMLISEGWSGHRRTETFTLLDEASHRATTLGWTAFYSPLTPGDGLHFGPGTELQLQDAVDYPYSRNGGGPACALDWTSDQHLTQGWVQARVPAYFGVRKNESRRERVTVTRGPGGTLSLVNGLGAPLEKFWYADERGKVFEAEGVEAGGQCDLRPAGGPVPALKGPGNWRAFYSADWLPQLAVLRRDPRVYLAPRCYVATLADTPFLEPGLARVRENNLHATVLGILPAKEGDDEG